jgi:hypothetical protein
MRQPPAVLTNSYIAVSSCGESLWRPGPLPRSESALPVLGSRSSKRAPGAGIVTRCDTFRPLPSENTRPPSIPLRPSLVGEERRLGEGGGARHETFPRVAGCLARGGCGTRRAAGPSAKEIPQLIERLGSNSFKEREKATRRLDQIGEAALPALREAERTGDAEVQSRARRLLRAILNRVCAVRCSIRGGGSHPVFGAALSADGRYVISGGGDGKIRLWDVGTGKEVRQLVGHAGGINALAFSPDGSRIASTTGGGQVFVWDRATDKKLVECGGHRGEIYDVTFSADGKRLLTSCSDRTLRLWDVATGKEALKINTPGDWPRVSALSPDGRRAATGHWDHAVRLWDLRTGKEIRDFKGHTYILSSITFSPDGKQVLSAAGDCTLRLWDVETGKEVKRFLGHSAYPFSARFSPDGKRIVSGSADLSVRLWDVASGQQIHNYAGHTAALFRVGFSADGRCVLSADMGGGINLWGVPKPDR